MKRAKIAICALIMTLLIGMVPMTAFAATGLNSYETALLAEIRAKLATFTMTPEQLSKSNAYIAQVQSYFEGDVDIDSAQYNTCSAQVANIETAVGGTDVTSGGVMDKLNLSNSGLNTVLITVAAALDLVAVPHSDGTITFKNTTGETVGGINPSAPKYTITAEGLRFTINAPFSKYTATYVDGKSIPSGQFTVSGTDSTIITLNQSYLKNGTYTLTVYFTEGAYVTTKFTVSQTGTGTTTTTTTTPVESKNHSISEIKSLPSNGGLRFTIEGSFDQYIATYVNGKDVPSNQLTIQKSANGKTIITLKQSYLKTLGGGTHIMYVSFAEGYSAQTTFTLSGGGIVLSTGGTIKQTGVPVGYLVFIGTAFMAIIASCAFAAKKKNLFAVHKAV